MNASDLISRAKDDGGLPKALNLTDQKILDAINSELASDVLLLIVTAGVNLPDDSADIPLVGGQATYPIPVRAALSKVNVISIVDSSGNESRPLSHIERGDIYRYAATGVPTGFYLLPGDIALVPAPSDGSYSLRVRYPRRSSDLVLSTLVATVVSASDTVLTVDAVPAGIVTGKKIDITQALSPFRLLAKDQAVTATGVGTITIGAGGLSALGIQAGDHVTLQYTAYTPQIPREWHELLLVRGVARLHHTNKDFKARDATLQLAKEKEKLLIGAQVPRAVENPRRLSAWRGHRRQRWGNL